MHLVAIISAIFALAALSYYLLSLVAARNFARQPRPSAPTPPVSILKPLKGCDPGMYESLLTHCHQKCPQFEIIFGVNNESDSAIPFIEKLKAEFPHVPIRTVISTQVLGANRKISNLVQMLEVAQFNHILINDADIRVPVNYLRDVMSHFVDAKVGMVTCLYRAVASDSVWAKIEALGINTDFIPGVLTARYLDGRVRFALGSTMAMSREALNAIGGLQPLVDHLADDYELGNRIANAGYKVVLARPVVETFLPDYNFRDFFQHQLRWGRTVRSSRPGGNFGLVMTFGLFWSLLAVMASGAALWSWILLGCVLIARVAVAVNMGMNVLLDPDALAHLWLLPLRDLIAPVIWLASLFGNRIVWRGEVFSLEKGKLRKT